jgi:hypothetical protein
MTPARNGSSIRYFRSFSGVRHPVHPIREIELADAKELTTYYEARFDNVNQLVAFIKHLRQVGDDGERWIVMFEEKYDYWKSGRLKTRTLCIPGQSDQTWSYADNARSWSRYFDDLFHRWFDGDEATDPSIAEKSLVLHEQFTTTETALFEAGVFMARDDEWTFDVSREAIECVREVMQAIAPDASLKISAGALGVDDVPKLLQGFDQPPLSLFGVLSEEAALRTPPDRAEIRTILPDEDFSQMGRNWATDSDAATIMVAPVVAVSEGELLPAFHVVLVASVRLDPKQIALAQSLLRRFVLFLERVVESSRNWSELAEHKDH